MENNEFVANYDYHQMNKYWLNIHSKTNYIATGINCITEICMFLVFHDSFLLNCSPISYIIRYILLPTSICFGICVACTISEKSLKLSLKQKQYIISFLSLCIAFVIASIHNAFVESLMALTLPMIFTILYEDKKLIYFIACASIVFQLISGLFIQFDSSKVLNSLYVLNMTIIIIFTFILFILSCNMMKFIHIRRIVIIKNEIERFELQKKYPQIL